MKKIQPIDETGRRMAQERYGVVEDRTRYGHSQMHQDLRPKYETPSHMADSRRGVRDKYDSALSPAESAQDAPGGARGGSIQHVSHEVNPRQKDRGHHGGTHHDHHHKHMKRPGGYGKRGAGGDGLTPYPGKRSV